MYHVFLITLLRFIPRVSSSYLFMLKKADNQFPTRKMSGKHLYSIMTSWTSCVQLSHDVPWVIINLHFYLNSHYSTDVFNTLFYDQSSFSKSGTLPAPNMRNTELWLLSLIRIRDRKWINSFWFYYKYQKTYLFA